MEEFIDESVIEEKKQEIIQNPERLEQEKQVIQKYGNIFNPSNLNNLTAEDFKSFLLMKNNKHWEGIHRQGNIITSDMNKLKKALENMLNESKSLEERLNFLFPNNKPNYIKGLGRAIATPILMMVYPNKYGVWNTKSESGLMKMGLLKDWRSKKSFADKYIYVNEILNDLAKKYNITLWQLDEIVGWTVLGNKPIGQENIIDIEPSNDIDNLSDNYPDEESKKDFGLESHLEDFLVENWEKLELGKKYDILQEEGDIVGQQYSTATGRIDLLARSKDKKEWLVIELKKGRSSDSVVGQALRYITWVKKNLAKPHETVKGLIILGEIDNKLSYSVEATDKKIDLMTYSVNFALKRY